MFRLVFFAVIVLLSLTSYSRAEAVGSTGFKSDAISALRNCKEHSVVGGDSSCFLNVFNEYKLDARAFVYHKTVMVNNNEERSGYNVYRFIKSEPKLSDFFKVDKSILVATFDVGTVGKLTDIIFGKQKEVLNSWDESSRALNEKIPPKRADVISQWIRVSNYKNIYMNQNEVVAYLNLLQSSLNDKIKFHSDGAYFSLLLAVLKNNFSDLNDVIRTDLAFVDLLENDGDLSSLAASKIKDNISRDEMMFGFINVLSLNYSFKDNDERLTDLIDTVGEIPKFRDKVEDAKILGPLALYAEKLKARGWVNGLQVLAESEYFSDKYTGYIFRVAQDDGYQVVQSSGSIVRMESGYGNPAIIIDFKNSPPPREGVSLSGRYLLLKKVGSYTTSLGTTRNAYFFNVAK